MATALSQFRTKIPFSRMISYHLNRKKGNAIFHRKSMIWTKLIIFLPIAVKMFNSWLRWVIKKSNSSRKTAHLHWRLRRECDMLTRKSRDVHNVTKELHIRVIFPIGNHSDQLIRVNKHIAIILKIIKIKILRRPGHRWNHQWVLILISWELNFLLNIYIKRIDLILESCSSSLRLCASGWRQFPEYCWTRLEL